MTTLEKAPLAPFFASVFLVNRLLEIESSFDRHAVRKGQHLRT